MIVDIKWDKECLREGDREITRDKLMRSKWNSNEYQQGTWRENLHHMVQMAENLSDNYNNAIQSHCVLISVA